MPARQQPFPFIYKRFSAFLFSTVPVLGMTVYLYGLRPVIMVVISVIMALLSDVLVSMMTKRKYDGRDLSSIMFAVIYVLLLPASIRYGIVIGGICFTLLVKHAFGGYGGCIFHPSAFGFAASAICWPAELFRYPAPFSYSGMDLKSGVVLFNSPAFTIRNGAVPVTIDRVDLLLGNHPGPLGASFCIVFIAILVFLIACKVTSWHIPFIYLLTAAAFSFAFPRLEIGRAESVLYELCSDILVFAAVYIAADPVTSPVNPKAKLIYGFLLGIVTMIFNYYGVFQFGVLFAVLLVNPLSPYLDRKYPSKGGGAR